MVKKINISKVEVMKEEEITFEALEKTIRDLNRSIVSEGE